MKILEPTTISETVTYIAYECGLFINSKLNEVRNHSNDSQSLFITGPIYQ